MQYQCTLQQNLKFGGFFLLLGCFFGWLVDFFGEDHTHNGLHFQRHNQFNTQWIL